MSNSQKQGLKPINVWMCQCDLCGKEEKAIMTNQRPTLPIGWGYNYDGRVHLCPECFKRVYGAGGIYLTLGRANDDQSTMANLAND